MDYDHYVIMARSVTLDANSYPHVVCVLPFCFSICVCWPVKFTPGSSCDSCVGCQTLQIFIYIVHTSTLYILVYSCFLLVHLRIG